jgi:hypothetical protein
MAPRQQIQPISEEEKQEVMRLSDDLPKLWNASSTSNEMRKRIIRTVIKEIVCDVDEDKQMIVLDVHWEGGVHTKVEVKRKKTGEHSNCTDKSIVELVSQLARQLPDKSIAPILNRLKLKTGVGNNWTADRVKSLRSHNRITAYSPSEEDAFLTLAQAAERLGICAQSVKILIDRKVIEAEQVVPYAPWTIQKQELEKDEVKMAVKGIKEGINRRNQCSRCENQIDLFQ